jgi:hypothetical protein
MTNISYVMSHAFIVFLSTFKHTSDVNNQPTSTS